MNLIIIDSEKLIDEFYVQWKGITLIDKSRIGGSLGTIFENMPCWKYEKIQLNAVYDPGLNSRLWKKFCKEYNWGNC